MLAKFSGLNAKGPSLSLEQKNFCVVLPYSIRWASGIRKFCPVVQQWLRNVQKRIMHRQSCSFAHLNLLLLLWSRNFAPMVTWRHASPLYQYSQWRSQENLTLCLLIGRIWGLWHDPLWENRDTSWFTEFCVFQASKDETEEGEGRDSRETLEGTHAWRFSLLVLKKSEKIILFCRPAWQGKYYRNREENSGAREREKGLMFLHFTLPGPVY